MDVHALESFLLTYGGLAAIAVALIEIVKRLHKPLVDKLELPLAILLVLVMGIAVKLSPDLPGYKELSWLAHIITLIMTGATTGVAHDNLLEPASKGLAWVLKVLGIKRDTVQ